MRAEELAERIGAGWPALLEQLGVPAAALVNKHGPCPACGGRDRFRFDNRHQRGDFYCNGCGAGSGYDLLMRVRGCDFRTALRLVAEAAGVSGAITNTSIMTGGSLEPEVARPSGRVLHLRRESCAVIDCGDAVEYLAARGLWPLPTGCSLRAHPSVEYFEAGHRIGRYPALLAPVLDLAGDLVTMHVTYLQSGKKLADHEPRKLLSPLTGRTGCAVQLQRVDGDVLGIGEGIGDVSGRRGLTRRPHVGSVERGAAGQVRAAAIHHQADRVR